jgi:hypothetical protein
MTLLSLAYEADKIRARQVRVRLLHPRQMVQSITIHASNCDIPAYVTESGISARHESFPLLASSANERHRQRQRPRRAAPRAGARPRDIDAD